MERFKEVFLFFYFMIKLEIIISISALIISGLSLYVSIFYNKARLVFSRSKIMFEKDPYVKFLVDNRGDKDINIHDISIRVKTSPFGKNFFESNSPLKENILKHSSRWFTVTFPKISSKKVLSVKVVIRTTFGSFSKNIRSKFPK